MDMCKHVIQTCVKSAWSCTVDMFGRRVCRCRNAQTSCVVDCVDMCMDMCADMCIDTFAHTHRCMHGHRPQAALAHSLSPEPPRQRPPPSVRADPRWLTVAAHRRRPTEQTDQRWPWRRAGAQRPRPCARGARRRWPTGRGRRRWPKKMGPRRGTPLRVWV